MTRSKLELAIILAKLRGDDSDPEQLAKEMSLMKLCYEIQKVEEEREVPPVETPSASPAPETPSPEDKLTKEEQKVVDELKVPQKITKEKRHKHILSWLLDSSSDEES